MADATPTPSTGAAAPRTWSTPTLKELPKLSKLTLASPIGGGGGTGGGGSTVFGFLLAVLIPLGLGACVADPMVDAPPPDVPPVASQVITCTVRRTAEALTCTTPEMAPGAGVIGGQGTHVALRSSGVSYDGLTDTLSATVTVQNLSVQAMGTQDGTTLSSGISVFFISGPEGPLGEAIGLNADGTGTFTAPNQAYFNYAEVLAPQGTSAGKTWKFDMNGTGSFTFSVLVAADLPSVGAFLSWRPDPLVGQIRFTDVGGWGNDGLALIGDYGLRSFYDGGVWRSHPDPLGPSASFVSNPTAINGPDQVFVISEDQLTIRYWDGISWRTISGLTGAPQISGFSIASTGPGSVYAGRDTVRKFTVNAAAAGGGTWSNLPDPTGSGTFASALSAANGKLFVAYNSGKVYVWNGIAWDSAGSSGLGAPNLVMGSDTNDVWVYSGTFPGHLMHYAAGGWTEPATPGALSDRSILHGIAAPDGDVFVMGFLSAFPYTTFIWHWDGASWTEELTTSAALSRLWARDGDTTYAVGTEGVVFRGVGATWTKIIGDVGPAVGSSWTSAYVAGPNDIFIGTSNQVIRHWNGTTWQPQSSTSLTNIRSLWGSGGSDVYAAGGDYVLEHYDGNSWSSLGGWPVIGVNGVGGSGPNDVWVVGYDGGGGNGNIVHYGGTWATSASPNSAVSLNAVWAGDASTAAAVGDGGAIFRWNGANWVQDASGTGSTLTAVWGSSASDIWAVGDGGTIRHWNGASWVDGGSGTCGGGNRFNAVWGRSSTEIYAGSSAGHLCFYNGTSWAEVIGSSNVSTIIYAIHGDALGATAVAVGNQVFRAAR